MTTRDPRSARTISALETALRESLSHGSLDDVSVSSLCRSAGIQRTSFYTHFVSVADLFARMLTESVAAVADVSATDDLSIAQLADEFQETLVAAFQVVQFDRPLWRAGFESDASALLRRSLTELIDTRLTFALDMWREHGVARDVDAPVARAFAAGGLVASLESWAQSDDEDLSHRAGAVRDQMAPWWPRS